MGRPLRMYAEHAMFFVTVRTVQGRLLLRPSPLTNAVVGGVLARAVERHGIRLHGYVVASNHIHLLCSSSGDSLSPFMGYLLGNISKKVGRLVAWSGPFWERRFSAEEVVDDAAASERLRYILAHGVKEGLVRRVHDWPGLHCAAHLLNPQPRQFPWFDWSARCRSAELESVGRFDASLARPQTLHLQLLPGLARLDAGARAAHLEALISDIELEGARRFANVKGASEIRRQPPHSRPAKIARRPRPTCHASHAVTRDLWKRRYAAFAASFRSASLAFRNGEWGAAFPQFAFRPPCAGRHKPWLTDTGSSTETRRTSLQY